MGSGTATAKKPTAAKTPAPEKPVDPYEALLPKSAPGPSVYGDGAVAVQSEWELRLLLGMFKKAGVTALREKNWAWRTVRASIDLKEGKGAEIMATFVTQRDKLRTTILKGL